MTMLEGLPTEVLCEIVELLKSPDVRALRLVNKSVGSIADKAAFKEICFCMCKRDFDMLEAIANHPVYSSHVTTLVYMVEPLSVERQTLEMYTRGVKYQDDVSESLKHIVGPSLGNMKREPTPPRLTGPGIVDDYHRYTRYYSEQVEIIDNNKDYEIIAQVMAKLPKLKNLLVAAEGELGRRRRKPYNDCRVAYDGRFVDDGLSVRHLRAMVKSMETSGTRPRTFRAGAFYFDFFDPGSFGLHSVTPNLLQNITLFEMMVVAVDDHDLPMNEEDMDDIEEQVRQCRVTMRKGTLRRVLDGIPNLSTLKLQFVEHHGEPLGTFDPPVCLSDVVPPNKHWPKLQRFEMHNVQTERQELCNFLIRHKESLKAYSMGLVKLATTSWRQTLPQLRAGFRGTDVQPEFLDLLTGRSEDGLEIPEQWNLGNPEFDRSPNMLGYYVHEYLKLPGKRTCPLNEDNMTDAGFFDEEEDEMDEEDDMDEEEDEWEDEDDEDEMADDQLPPLVP
ncbi:hypothetical protein OQA88_9958 [Cercophora sp. LCS_1]